MPQAPNNHRATDWRHRAKRIPRRPNPVDVIPQELWELGEVFFPIPRGEKGWNYPHHMDEYRFHPDSEELNAYLEQGWGYGVACANDLAVVDIDELEFKDEIVSELPPTVWQKTGSREGIHLFYHVPGLNNRVMMYNPIDHDCSNEEHDCEYGLEGDCGKEKEYEHIGEVKCDPHGYVVGPNSKHPSGNIYGPVRGDSIATISKEKLMEVVGDFQKPDSDRGRSYDPSEHYDENSSHEIHEFYELTADDVLPWLGQGERISHPVHGSSTGSNFMKNDGGDTFTCWRCSYGSGEGCGLNGAQFLAAEAMQIDCDDVRRRWEDDSLMHYKAWKHAVEKSLISYSEIPYRVSQGYAIEEGVLEPGEKLDGELYFEITKALRYEMEILDRKS